MFLSFYCLVFFFALFFFFKQKTAYEMRISDWSSDVCSSDLRAYIMAEDGVLSADALQPQIAPDGGSQTARVTVPLGVTLAEADRRLIMATLERCGGVKKQTAAVLGISAKTLYNRLEEYTRAGHMVPGEAGKSQAIEPCRPGAEGRQTPREKKNGRTW